MPYLYGLTPDIIALPVPTPPNCRAPRRLTPIRAPSTVRAPEAGGALTQQIEFTISRRLIASAGLHSRSRAAERRGGSVSDNVGGLKSAWQATCRRAFNHAVHCVCEYMYEGAVPKGIIVFMTMFITSLDNSV